MSINTVITFTQTQAAQFVDLTQQMLMAIQSLSSQLLQGMSATNSVLDSGGMKISPDNFAHSFTYNSDGTIATDYFTNGVNTWTQSFTYANGQLTGVSQWARS